MDKYPISASSLEKFYYVDGHQLERQYKEHLSDYLNWKDEGEGAHADTWLVFPQNVGPRMSIDETSLSDGELYTIVSNKDAKGKRGALAAIVLGTKSEDVIAALKNIDQSVRETVTEITLDLSSSMRKIAHRAFPKAVQVTDRFHVQKLAMEALQEMRISFRWDAINEENRQTAENKAARKRGEDVEEYEPEVFENGDTRKQLLARSRYLLFKSRNKWTESQKKRAKILFELYPDIENAYNLTDELRRIYSSTKIKGVAYTKLAHWYKHVEDAGYDSFQVVKQTIYENYIDILNFFDNRSTNASAESFNAKIKNFRAQLRGISDVKYFLFRLQKIYANTQGFPPDPRLSTRTFKSVEKATGRYQKKTPRKNRSAL